jgi:hypothetical protein
MWLPSSSFMHTGHTPLSMFPLISFNLQMPVFHHPVPFFLELWWVAGLWPRSDHSLSYLPSSRLNFDFADPNQRPIHTANNTHQRPTPRCKAVVAWSWPHTLSCTEAKNTWNSSPHPHISVTQVTGKIHICIVKRITVLWNLTEI